MVVHSFNSSSNDKKKERGGRERRGGRAKEGRREGVQVCIMQTEVSLNKLCKIVDPFLSLPRFK